MPFSNFTNPYQNPPEVPLRYGKHPNLSKLFKVDGSYRRRLGHRTTLIPVPDQGVQKEIAAEVAKLRGQAETLVTEAKARVERMILGRE